jgi:hypothetical protein
VIQLLIASAFFLCFNIFFLLLFCFRHCKPKLRSLS